MEGAVIKENWKIGELDGKRAGREGRVGKGNWR